MKLSDRKNKLIYDRGYVNRKQKKQKVPLGLIISLIVVVILLVLVINMK